MLFVKTKKDRTFNFDRSDKFEKKEKTKLIHVSKFNVKTIKKSLIES